MSKKRCSKCYKIKDRSEFYKNRCNKDGLMYYCSVCDTKRLRKVSGTEERRLEAGFFYGEGDVLKNKQYIKDRIKMFQENGNGWWYMYDALRNNYPSVKTSYGVQVRRKRFVGKFIKNND